MCSLKLSGPFAVIDEHFNSILPNCYDAIGLMLMIGIIRQHQVMYWPSVVIFFFFFLFCLFGVAPRGGGVCVCRVLLLFEVVFRLYHESLKPIYRVAGHSGCWLSLFFFFFSPTSWSKMMIPSEEHIKRRKSRVVGWWIRCLFYLFVTGVVSLYNICLFVLWMLKHSSCICILDAVLSLVK